MNNDYFYLAINNPLKGDITGMSRLFLYLSCI